MPLTLRRWLEILYSILQKIEWTEASGGIVQVWTVSTTGEVMQSTYRISTSLREEENMGAVTEIIYPLRCQSPTEALSQSEILNVWTPRVEFDFFVCVGALPKWGKGAIPNRATPRIGLNWSFGRPFIFKPQRVRDSSNPV